MRGGNLERRYRRLLLGYPRSYRRSRGDELIATLLEAAPPGRTRPGLREAVDLVRHGLRARIGRPASRTVVAWAVLATVIGGLFGVAFAVRAGWETARPLPGTAEARSMLAEILPGQEFNDVEGAPALFLIYGAPLGWGAVDDLLLGDGGEYAQAGVGAGAPAAAVRDPRRSLELAREHLRETGWRVSELAVQESSTMVSARRGDTVFVMEIYPDATGSSTALTVRFQRATPVAVYPAALAGGVLGAVLALLLFGWASRRTDGPHPARRTVHILFVAVMVFWWLPTLFALPLMVRHHLDGPHPIWHPMWEWFGQPVYSLAFVVGGGCALLGLALAALPRTRTATRATRVAG